MKKFFFGLLLISSFNIAAGFTVGLGYIKPQEYRVGNNINPLPFGLSIVPMFAYRGERLSILGPTVSYSLLKGPIGFGLRLNPTGDRYESDGIETRDTAINGGVFLRLLFLTLNYGRDLSSTYNSYTASATLSWRFKILENLFFSPGVTQRLLSRKYVNYYYGIRSTEAGRFSPYQTGDAQNTTLRLGLDYSLNKNNSISSNYSHRFFDPKIYRSPTVGKKSHGTISIFWNYTF